MLRRRGYTVLNVPWWVWADASDTPSRKALMRRALVRLLGPRAESALRAAEEAERNKQRTWYGPSHPDLVWASDEDGEDDGEELEGGSGGDVRSGGRPSGRDAGLQWLAYSLEPCCAVGSEGNGGVGTRYAL